MVVLYLLNTVDYRSVYVQKSRIAEDPCPAHKAIGTQWRAWSFQMAIWLENERCYDFGEWFPHSDFNK